MGEEFTATPVSALNFIENQDRSCLAASFAEFLHKFGGRYLDTSDNEISTVQPTMEAEETSQSKSPCDAPESPNRDLQ